MPEMPGEAEVEGRLPLEHTSIMLNNRIREALRTDGLLPTMPQPVTEARWRSLAGEAVRLLRKAADDIEEALR